MNPPNHDLSRRSLLTVAAGAGSVLVVPRRVLGVPQHKAPSDRLNIAGIGIGGMGANYLKNLESENIVALCDVDDTYAAPTFNRYPKATRYRDFRKLLDKEKGIDAVVIGTPDHTHAVVATAAMQLGKHIYCAKPMARTIQETDTLLRTARETKVATQMSVQTCGSDRARTTAEWVQSGAIGKVREVHVWSDRPLWPQGLTRPEGTPPVPADLDWDLWLGPAPYRPYNPAYVPWNWRAWWDFGTGALGDMGCHTLHVIFTALNLTHAQSISANTSGVLAAPANGRAGGAVKMRQRVQTPETAPACSIVTWSFAARDTLPPVRVTWYDGGLKPPRPLELDSKRSFGRDGILFVGEDGILLSGFYGGPELLPAARMTGFKPPEKTLPRTKNHYQEWVTACKGGPAACCEFGFASLLAEAVLLGDIAVRTGRYLEWDAEARKFTNDAEANRYLAQPYREGWTLGG